MAQSWMAEEIQAMDPFLQPLTKADHLMIGAYGDTLHGNGGTHLTGGIYDDKY